MDLKHGPGPTAVIGADNAQAYGEREMREKGGKGRGEGKAGGRRVGEGLMFGGEKRV